MEFRPLGRTGVSVSKFCFGAGMFGYFGNNDKKECKRMVDHAISEGINYFDTSPQSPSDFTFKSNQEISRVIVALDGKIITDVGRYNEDTAEVVYVAHLRKADIDKRKAELELELRRLNTQLKLINASQKISINMPST